MHTGAAGASPTLDHDHHSIRLRYAAASYTQPHATTYRARLVGLNDTWSDWSGSTQRDFTNLPPGSYTFEVQARTARSGVTPTAQYAFTVLPPWYRTAWAYALYFFGALGLITGVVQWRTHALRRQQRHLEQIVDERTVEISRKNDQLAQQTDRLQSLDRAKSQFFANISHELRTPLTLILGPVRQLLQHHNGNAAAKNRLTLVERNAERLLSMVQQLLELARFEADTLAIAPQPCDLGKHLARYARTFADLGAQHEVEVRVEHTGPPDDADPAYADLDYMEQVVSNLVGNAVKFTPAGGHVVVRISETACETRLLVADTGIGIAPQHHRSIFERFQQVDGSPTRTHEGAGIGLALTQDLVEAHGGRITVDSALGEGATFVVLLPRGREALPKRHRPPHDATPEPRPEDNTASDGAGSPAQAPPFLSADDEASGDTAVPAPESGAQYHEQREAGDSTDYAGRQQVPEAPVPSRAPLVLVVDDNDDMRAYVRSVLEEDFRLIEANDGREGIAQATAHLPDLILADVMMPGMDGLAMTRVLRDTSETASIPVVMLTARADVDSEMQGLEGGATDYITKPFNPSILQMRVHGIMQWMQRLKRRLRNSTKAKGNAPALADSSDDNTAGNGTSDADTQHNAMSDFERQARSIVRDHLTESEFDVDDLAEAFAVSRSTLYRRARSNDMPSPAVLLRQMRMDAAHRLLEAGEGTVTEVGYAVGYESLSSFSDQFHSHFGYPPSQVPTKA